MRQEVKGSAAEKEVMICLLHMYRLPADRISGLIFYLYLNADFSVGNIHNFSSLYHCLIDLRAVFFT